MEVEWSSNINKELQDENRGNTSFEVESVHYEWEEGKVEAEKFDNKKKIESQTENPEKSCKSL